MPATSTAPSTPQLGASVTSGTVSAFEALTAGDVTINTVALVAMAEAADAEARVDQLVAAVNQAESLTGVRAIKVTAATFKLVAGVSIVVAALAGTATLANTGLTAATTAFSSANTPLLATRKAFGNNVSGTDADVVLIGNLVIDVKSAKAMGLIERQDTTDVELARSWQ